MRARGGEPSRPPPARSDIVEEHLDELAFLAVQRRKLLFSTDSTLGALAALDARVEAHRDALRTAAGESAKAAASRLSETDPWRLYAAAFVWLSVGRPAPDVVLRWLKDADESEAPSWREALRQLDRRDLRRFVPLETSTALAPDIAALVVDAYAWHGLIARTELEAFGRSEHPRVRAAAARGLGLLVERPADAGAALDRLASDPDGQVSVRAVWGMVLVAPGRAKQRLREAVERPSPDLFAIQALGLAGDAEDIDRVLPLVASPAHRPAAVRALGALGDLAVMPLVLTLLDSDDAATARAAGDAFETLAGRAHASLRRRPGSANDVDELLDGARVRDAWKRTEAKRDASRRWLGGREFPGAGPLDDESLLRLWRLAVAGCPGAPGWLRREAPDGFYEAHPVLEARPGE